MNWSQLFEEFQSLRALVIGDLMLDAYLYGKVSRISPEAPVPVVEWQREEARPGGAANVALNVAAFGATPLLCGVAGADQHGEQLQQLLEELQISTAGVCISNTRKTTVKQRIIAGGQQLARIDKENARDLDSGEKVSVVQRVREMIAIYKPDVAVLQDYDKGVLSLEVIQELLSLLRSNGIPVCVDPKRKNFWAYQNVELFKPNLREISEALGREVQPTAPELGKASRELQNRLGCSACLITLSDKGAWFRNEDVEGIFPTVKRNVADVSGAGDTVIAAAALGLAAGLPGEMVVRLANMAGSQVVEQVGVVPVNQDQLLGEMKKLSSLLPDGL